MEKKKNKNHEIHRITNSKMTDIYIHLINNYIKNKWTKHSIQKAEAGRMGFKKTNY